MTLTESNAVICPFETRFAAMQTAAPSGTIIRRAHLTLAKRRQKEIRKISDNFLSRSLLNCVKTEK